MTVTVEKSKAVGTVCAPPSKSAAHRALICGALSPKSKISNIEYSQDISATLDCLEVLGANVRRHKDFVVIGGLNPFESKSVTLNCRESGSTLRFLIPLCMLSGSEITLVGSKRLFLRNLEIYEDIANLQGITFERREDSLKICGRLLGGDFKISGEISSQFISGLLFALPLCREKSTITITGNYESAPYVALTKKVISDFGVDIKNIGKRTFKIEGGMSYKPFDCTVEGDCSNAAFLDGFNLLGGDVTVEGINDDTLQGDIIYKKMFDELKEGKKEFDISDFPDLAPVMFALSAVYGGAHFTGTKRLKIKESDRAESMKQELSKFGITVSVSENEVTVSGGKFMPPKVCLCGHNDHRIVMALTLLLTLTGGSIDGAEAVAKSYPDFFENIKTLGIVIKNEA